MRMAGFEERIVCGTPRAASPPRSSARRPDARSSSHPGALERGGDDCLQTVPGGVGLAEGELREAGRGQQALVDAQKLETFDPASSQHKGREMEGIEGPERHRACHPPCEVAHRWSQLPDTQRPRGVAKQETTGTTSSYIPEKIFQGCATTMQP